MSNPTHRKKSSAKRSNVTQMMRSKTTLGLVATVIVLGFVAALVAFNDPTSNDDPEGRDTHFPSEEDEENNPTPDPEVEPTVAPSATCTSKPAWAGTTLVPFDSLDEVKVIDGEPEVTIDPDGKTGKGSLRVEVGQKPDDVWIRADLKEPLGLDQAELALWFRQNGNLISGEADWSVRFFSDSYSFFQYAFQPASYRAAIDWCWQPMTLADMQPSGTPDASKITRIELSVPGYEGYGVGNTVWFDGLSIKS